MLCDRALILLAVNDLLLIALRQQISLRWRQCLPSGQHIVNPVPKPRNVRAPPSICSVGDIFLGTTNLSLYTNVLRPHVRALVSPPSREELWRRQG